MKREGRQHGMVRTHSILPPPLNLGCNSKTINRLGSPPTAGLFTKVSSKPTNHSKFTSRCGRPRCEGCHEHPACKSKDKTKGAQKLRSYDVDKNHRLIAWQLVDKGHGMNFVGISATGILDHLSSNYYNDEGEDEIIDVYDDSSVALADGLATKSRRMEEEAGIGYGGIEIEEADDNDEGTSFCNVGFVMDEEDGEEGWCLVGEM